MKKSHIIWPVLAATSALAVPANDSPEDSFMDHLTFSARFGLNISAKFGPRTTPDGGLYNFVDGYVLTDSTGDFDPTGTFPGITQYWGYDNSSRQRDGTPTFVGNGVNGLNGVTYPTVAMTRGATGTDLLNNSSCGDPGVGGELSYMREFHRSDNKKWRWGGEVAVNYTSLCMNDNGGFTGSAVQEYFPYFNGTIPPVSPTTGGQPYQGPFAPSSGGPQHILIGDTPIGSASVPVSIISHRQFDADIWGFRLGPYLQRTIGEKHRAEINLIGGLAVVVVNASASWTETTTINGVTDPAHTGSGSGSDVLWGYYVGANLSWHLNKRWDMNGGVQYQDVGTYRQTLGSREVELDLGGVIFFTVGISYKF